MKTMNEVRERLDRALISVREWALLRHAAMLAVVLAAYATGLLAVDMATGDARFPVVLVAVFFLPVVARSWLQVYWEVRAQLKDRFRFSNGRHVM